MKPATFLSAAAIVSSSLLPSVHDVAMAAEAPVPAQTQPAPGQVLHVIENLAAPVPTQATPEDLNKARADLMALALTYCPSLATSGVTCQLTDMQMLGVRSADDPKGGKVQIFLATLHADVTRVTTKDMQGAPATAGTPATGTPSAKRSAPHS